jgi:hypothetical protein
MSRTGLLLAAAACAVALVIRLILLAQPIGGDPGIYAYVGSRILAGELPYRDVFEQKPPGILYTYAAAFAIFGRSMAAVQIADFVAWLATVGAVGALAHAVRRDRAVTALSVTLAALFINPTLQSSFKQVGQSETFLAAWATLSVALALRTGLPSAFFAGICVGIASLYKYNAAISLIVAAVAVFARDPSARFEGRPLRRALALLLGFATPLAATLAYFAFKGGLADVYEATVRYNIEYTAGTYGSVAEFLGRAGVMTWRFATMNVLWTAGGAGTLLLAWQAMRGDRIALVPVVFVGAAYLAILANARFYPQYFLQILPALAVTGACFLASAWRVTWLAGRRALGVACLALLAIHLARHTDVARLAADVAAAARYATGRIDIETYYARFDTSGVGRFSLLADYRLARRIVNTTRPEDPVYIYGGEPLVLFLAGRESPSRFVWNDPFDAGAYRGRYAHADLVRELERRPPAYFIVLRHDANMIDPVESIVHYRRSPELQQFVTSRFEELGWFGDFLLFRRKTTEQSGGRGVQKHGAHGVHGVF